MKKTDKLKQIIKSYQEEMDKHFSSYQEEEKIAREKFSENGFKTEFMLGTYPKYAGGAQAKADEAVRKTNDIFSGIEDDFKSWVMRPLSGNVVEVLNCINAFDLRLSIEELRIIEGDIRNSYIGLKIFRGLAQKNGYKIDVPSADEYLKVLESSRKNVEVAIKAYAGSGPEYIGKDLIQERTFNGVSMGEYAPHQLYFASNFLREGGTLDRLEELLNPTKTLTYVLNANETEKVKGQIKTIVNSSGEVEKTKAKKLTEQEPGFISRLKSMPQEEMKGLESVSKYFHLDDGEKENMDSKISPLVGNDKYEPGFGQVNQEALKQYM